MLREPSTGSMVASLARRWAAPRWALLPQVPTHTGPRDGARIVDFVAVDLWLRAFWWIATAPGKVQAVKRHVPDGWGLLSVGTGEPHVITPAPEHDAVAPSLDIFRGMLRASGNAAPPPAAVSKILARRVSRSARAAVTRLDVALAAIEEASPEQLRAIEGALAGRRAA
jgi:hypothetical protein